MEKIVNIVNSFVAEIKPIIKDRPLVIIAYGSRVLNTNREDSDLDLLIITNGTNNYRISRIISSIKVDCTIYGVTRLFSLIEANKQDNNTYFNSVLNTGYVIKDEIGLIEYIEEQLSTLAETKLPKRTPPVNAISELQDLYIAYKDHPNYYNYFNLLEKIRNIYHYKNRFSYLSLTKIFAVYQNPTKYQETYLLVLPKSSFITAFLKASGEADQKIQLSSIQELLHFLNLPASFYYGATPSVEKETPFLTPDEIKYKLLLYYNRLCELKRLATTNNPSFSYILSVTLRQLLVLGNSINHHSLNTDDYVPPIINEESPLNQIKMLWELFMKIGHDYHFDYDKFVLKLK